MKLLFQTALILLLMSGVAHADLNNGLIGWWQFDEGSAATASDSSGNGNVGTLVNSPPTVNGKIRSALSFNGSNQYITLGSISYPTAFSFSSWVYLTGGQGTQRCFWRPSGFLGLYAYTDNKFYLYDQGPASISTASLNRWYHVVITTANGSLWNMYVDGVNQGSGTTIGSLPQTSVARIAGDTFGQLMFGYMDDVRMYNRRLTDTEVNDLFLIGQHRVQPGNNSTFGTFRTSN